MSQETLLLNVIVCLLAEIERLQALHPDDKEAHSKRLAAVRQARCRAKKNAKGLVQVPVYVSVDSRPDMWSLSRAFEYAPRYYFDATLGSLRDKDGVYQQANSFTSPKVLEERQKSGLPPSRKATTK